jgi:hypothetical protein
MFDAGNQPRRGLLGTASMVRSPRWLRSSSPRTDEVVRQAKALGGKVLKGLLDRSSGGQAVIIRIRRAPRS